MFGKKTTGNFVFTRLLGSFAYPILIVSLFLLTFLLLGCTAPGGAYSDVYLVQIRLNQNSTMFPIIEKAYKSSNVTNLENIEIRAGFSGVCLITDEMTNCATSSQAREKLTELPPVNLFASSQNNTSTIAPVDLVSMGVTFAQEAVSPSLLITALVGCGLTFIVTIYSSCSLLPGHLVMLKVKTVLAFLTTFIWGLGALWIKIACDVTVSMMPLSSLNTVLISTGKRAQIMAWLNFGFLCYVFLSSLLSLIRHIKLKMEIESPEYKV